MLQKMCKKYEMGIQRQEMSLPGGSKKEGFSDPITFELSLSRMARLRDVEIEENVFRTQRTRAGTTHGLEKAWDRYGVSTSVNAVEGM